MSLKDKYTEEEWDELQERVLNKMSLPKKENSEDTIEKYPKINRVEVISQYGRQYTNYDAKDVELSFQDGGKTLKIFLKDGGI